MEANMNHEVFFPEYQDIEERTSLVSEIGKKEGLFSFGGTLKRVMAMSLEKTLDLPDRSR